jgi:hypothetical protein
VIKLFPKAELTMVAVALTDVANEYTVSLMFLLNILISAGSTGSDRQENNGKRWQV